MNRYTNPFDFKPAELRPRGCIWPKECACAMCMYEIGAQEKRMSAKLPDVPKQGPGPFKSIAFRRSKRDPVMQRCSFCGDDVVMNPVDKPPRSMVYVMLGNTMLGQVCENGKCAPGMINHLMGFFPHQSIVHVDRDGVEVRLPK